MKLITNFHPVRKVFLLLIFTSALAGCQSAKYSQMVNDLSREGNELLRQESVIRSEWKAEFNEYFNPAKRAGFPLNRQELRPHAENQIRLLEQMQALTNSAAGKFEQANGAASNDKEAQFTRLIAASIKKEAESYRLFEEQMNLVFDENITDAGTFETKFSDLMQRIWAKTKESDDLKSEAEKLIGR